jgi:hypothetical protein
MGMSPVHFQLGILIASSVVFAATKEALPQPHVVITVKGDVRTIETNAIPNHATGKFPGPGNPNAISAQKFSFKVPVNPKANDKPTKAQGPTTWGIALNGIPFDPNTAEYWNRDRSNGWNEDLMGAVGKLGADQSNAHVQPEGTYHYHAKPVLLIEALGGDNGRTLLVGYAADGFPIYTANGHKDPKDLKSPVVALKSSYQLKEGNRPSGTAGPGGKYDGKYTVDWQYVAGKGELDEANGRFEVTAEYPKGTYVYHMTDTFPYISRMFKGTPDSSFKKGPGTGGARSGGAGGPGGARRGGQGGPPNGRPQ